MRHRAQPADPKDKDRNVPIGERLHVRVSAENKDEMLFWFQKVRIAAAVLNVLDPHLMADNGNGKSPRYSRVTSRHVF
jgi:hypothetical protein